MAKEVILKFSNFSGGISDDPRENNDPRIQDSNEFVVSKHFDIFSQPNRLIPYRSLEADTHDGSTATGMRQYSVQDFLYTTGSAKIYGLGQNGSGQTKIVYKADINDASWTLPASSEGNGAVKNGCLVEYKDYLWGFQGTTQVFRWGLLSGVPAITNSQGTVGATITSVAQGVIGKDGNLYLPYNNKLVRVTSGGTVNDAVLTLPTNFKITSICNYGNYLAIGCAPVSVFGGVSKVFLWNFGPNDVQEAIDWGEGELRVLESIEGTLVGVTDRYLNDPVGLEKGSMIIQMYSGGAPRVVKEIFSQALTAKSIPTSKGVKNNRLFWAAKIMTNSAGTEYNEGLWSFGRKNVNYPYSLAIDVIDENIDTDGIQSFGIAGNYFLIAHSGNGSIDKTDNSGNYTFSSILETQVIDFGDVDNDKTLESVKVYFRKLASDQALTVKYKVDEATTWTTIGTFNTVGELSVTFLNIESSDTAFASGKEYQFQLLSTGGLEITGYKLQANLNDAI